MEINIYVYIYTKESGGGFSVHKLISAKFFDDIPQDSRVRINLQLTLSFSPDDGLIHTADDRKRELLSSSFSSSHLFSAHREKLIFAADAAKARKEGSHVPRSRRPRTTYLSGARTPFGKGEGRLETQEDRAAAWQRNT